MNINNYRLNSAVVFLLSLFFFWFFFFCKHYYLFANVITFNDDPYDAVGSIGIQVSFFAASLSLIRTFVSYIKRKLAEDQIILILRGNLVALLSIEVTMISNLTSLVRYIDKWIKNSMGITLVILVFSFLLLTIIIHFWSFLLVRKINIPFIHRHSYIKILWPISGFIILFFYPIILRESIIGAIFTACFGMILQITIVKSLSLLMLPSLNLKASDIIDDIRDLLISLRNHSAISKRLLDKIEALSDSPKLKPLIKWLNPRKHKLNLVVCLCICSGIAVAIIQTVDEGWSGFNVSSFLVLLLYVSLEFIVLLLFYLLFSDTLGIIRKKRNLCD